MKRTVAILLVLVAISVSANADHVLTETARNAHDYTLKLSMYNWVNGSWRGNASFTLSACSQSGCFHLAGSVLLPINPSTHLNEGTFPVPGSACNLRFQEVSHNEMDSGDWRISLIGRGVDGNGCTSLPADLAGEYIQESADAPI